MKLAQVLKTVFFVTVRLWLFSLKQCIIKQLLDSVFVISEIIKVSVSITDNTELDSTQSYSPITYYSTNLHDAHIWSESNCYLSYLPAIFSLFVLHRGF